MSGGRLLDVTTPPLRRILFALALVGWLLVGPLGWAQDDSQPDDETSTESSTKTAAEPEADSESESEPKPEPSDDETPVVELISGKVVTGKIDGDITLAEAAFVSRLVEQARLQNAEVLALELNTFGGRIDAAVAIRDLLMDAPQETVVFINKRAISAGALISFACDKIAISPGGTIGAAMPVTMAPGQDMAQPVEEKYVSYFREEMRATAETQGRNGDIAVAMADPDFEIEGLVEKGKILTLTSTAALEHQVADLEAETLRGALGALGHTGELADVGRSWSEQLAAFLTSQAIASLLFTAMMVLGYMEFQTPGFGVFGGLAIACFLLLYFSHYMVNLAGYEELLLFGIGVILIVIEMFVIPGFGVPGILGAMSVLASMVLMISAGDWSDIHIENPITIDAVNQVAITLVVAFVAILALIRMLPQTRYAGGIVLDNELAAAGGWTSHEVEAPDLMGQTGVAVSTLRPSGRANIGGQRMRVETEGDFLDEGTPIKIVRQVEGRVIVRKTTQAATDAETQAGETEADENQTAEEVA